MAMATCGYSLLCSHQTRFGKSERYISSGLVAVVQKADRKFTLIPVVFILLRIWGTIQFFYSIVVTRSIPNYNECVSNGVSIGFLILGYLQVCMYVAMICELACYSLSNWKKNS